MKGPCRWGRRQGLGISAGRLLGGKAGIQGYASRDTAQGGYFAEAEERTRPLPRYGALSYTGFLIVTVAPSRVRARNHFVNPKTSAGNNRGSEIAVHRDIDGGAAECRTSSSFSLQLSFASISATRSGAFTDSCGLQGNCSRRLQAGSAIHSATQAVAS